MKYPYIVNKNGIWYPAGAEVPQEINIKEEKQEKKYTKTEISRMNVAELKELAIEIGVENASETSGSELKKILIEHFGL